MILEMGSVDRENGNTYWQDAIAEETGQLFEYKVFRDLGKNAAVPKGYQQIKLRIVFDVKQSLKRKARIVTRGDMTDPQTRSCIFRSSFSTELTYCLFTRRVEWFEADRW